MSSPWAFCPKGSVSKLIFTLPANAYATTNGGDAGTQNGGYCSGDISCDTQGYVAAVNAAGYGISEAGRAFQAGKQEYQKRAEEARSSASASGV